MAFQYYYRLNSGLADAAGVAGTATYGGVNTYTPTAEGTGALLNANTKYIFTPTVSGSASGLTYTLGIRYATTEAGAAQTRMISLYPTAAANASVGYGATANVLRRGNTAADASIAGYNDGKLHRCIATKLSGTGKSLYVDGVIRGTGGNSANEAISALAIYYNGYNTTTAQKTSFTCDDAFMDNALWGVAKVKNDYLYYKGYFSS